MSRFSVRADKPRFYGSLYAAPRMAAARRSTIAAARSAVMSGRSYSTATQMRPYNRRRYPSRASMNQRYKLT